VKGLAGPGRARIPVELKSAKMTSVATHYGIILAVPILATFKIFCDHIEPMAPIGGFMS
jgi:hypothetical protein